MKKLNKESLRALGQACQPAACTCSLGPCAGWESFTEERWPTEQMSSLGTLRDADDYMPTQEEHHPNGTRYGSFDAPIAVDFSPYNVSDVFECNTCKKVLLRYTEFGGYYVDHRVRELGSELVV